jgi:DNA-binding MarR family transcriptional regulator
MPRAPSPARSKPGLDARVRTSPASKTFRIADYPFYRLNRVAALYSECLDRELKPRGTDQPRWRVLMILNEHNPAAMGVIAELAVMKLPTLLKVVQRMTEEGLVRNGPRLSDQRVTEVSITPKGRKSLTVIRRVAANVYARVTSQLSSKDVEMLNSLLGTLEASFLAMRGERRPIAPTLAARSQRSPAG